MDFDRPETLAAAFAGVDRLLLISTDSLGTPGHRIAQHRAAIDAAVAAGVKHLLYTSTTNASLESAALVASDHYQTEQAIHASGLGYTILRNSLYTDNLLPGLPQSLSTGQWYHAAGDGKIAMNTREDCARTAAAALESSFDGRQILEVTGGELLDHDETAAIIREVTGRPLTAIAVDAASLVAGMTRAGLPAAFAEVLASFDTAQANGEYAIATPVIRDLTGHEPVSVRDFLLANRSRLIG